MRVLQLIDHTNGGGAQRHFIGLVTALLRQPDLEVLAAAGHSTNTSVRSLDVKGTSRKVEYNYVRHITDLIREFQPDLIHAHLHGSYCSSSRALERLNLRSETPLVITEHSMATWRSPSDRADAARAYAGAAELIAVSSEIARRLVDVDGVARERITILESAPFQDAFSDHVPFVQAQANSAHVGFVGRLEHEKGPDLFLSTARLVAEQTPTARFIVRGDGSQLLPLKAQARSLSLESQVKFVPFTASPPSELGILVITSRTEGTPLILLDAMAAGIPVVGFKVGGLPDVLPNSPQRWTSRQDTRQLARLVSDLLASPERRDHLVAGAFDRLAGVMTPAEYARQVAALYRRVRSR